MMDGTGMMGGSGGMMGGPGAGSDVHEQHHGDGGTSPGGASGGMMGGATL